MTILIIGNEGDVEECKLKFGMTHTFIQVRNHTEAVQYFLISDVVFDFIIEANLEKIEIYVGANTVPVFFNTAKLTLRKIRSASAQPLAFPFFGFNGLPTLVNRPVLEVSLLKKEDHSALQLICSQLTTDFLMVEDSVGLITPRVICMIINEAYLTAEEGTATREDIDMAMKLGTNYPFGPFEWSARIGLKNVYEILMAVYQETKDDRYKISALLSKEALAVG
jgi:3-hydroxybutyryl-CoA dehydrogenase